MDKKLKQPDLDIIGIWKGFGHQHGREKWDSKARIRIWKGNPNFVVMSDLDEDDTGSSITNSSEYLATLIKAEFQLQNGTFWFEHYPRHNTDEITRKSCQLQEDISLVSYDWNEAEHRYHHPGWRYIERDKAESMIGGSLDMEGYQSLPIHQFKSQKTR